MLLLVIAPMARVTGGGRHTGELMGVPPTGKRLEMTGIVIYRIEGGKSWSDGHSIMFWGSCSSWE